MDADIVFSNTVNVVVFVYVSELYICSLFDNIYRLVSVVFFSVAPIALDNYFNELFQSRMKVPFTYIWICCQRPLQAHSVGF